MVMLMLMVLMLMVLMVIVRLGDRVQDEKKKNSVSRGEDGDEAFIA
jgi:hypothetical protein